MTTTVNSLLNLLEKFPSCRIAVVGDLMLDRYIWGKADRISQEAPVPVVRVNRETQAMGGAANVVNNVVSLGGQATVYGIVGPDSHGQALREMFEQKGVDTRGLITAADRATTVKTRVIANHQQIVRIDREETGPLPTQVRQQITSQLLNDLRHGRFDAIIFEDYAKGLLTSQMLQEAVDLARQQGVITALDPHPSHAFNMHGLSLMTPNRAEAFGLAGVYYQEGVIPIAEDTALLDVGQRLRHLWQVELLLITLGGDGMALFNNDKVPVHIPTRAREVYDVSGAGDTVTASFVLARTAGASPVEAAMISNHAAGIVVAKVGTLPVAIDELRQDLKECHETSGIPG